MASLLSIYSLYKVPHESMYYLLRTERPGFSNASQDQEDLAHQIEENKRSYMLTCIGKNLNLNDAKTFECIGELQGFPIGDALYADHGNTLLNIYILETAYGKPWIILGAANTAAEFLAELNEDEDLMGLKPIGQPQNIQARFFTEQDFDLSSVEHSTTKDLR